MMHLRTCIFIPVTWRKRQGMNPYLVMCMFHIVVLSCSYVGAMFVLKRAKLFEKQIDQISGKKMNIEMQVMALENAAGNSDLFKVMQAGQQALNHAIKET